ncbi:MAG: ABC transporter permease [Chloroflexi bacterium HGW-Chloroflexi-2]|jgi:alpha-1,4-digalacturonate transport system permease protein|nr:MAG: ABC transporter permease [Chloroflexi bacterium HGW-Chloroflexi-2]
MDIKKFLFRTRISKKIGVSDILTYLYLFFGVILMFGPVLWLILSSFKTPAALVKFPPSILPYGQESIVVEGFDDPLPLYIVTFPDGSEQKMAQVRRVGLEAQMIDPENPSEIVKVSINDRTESNKLQFEWANYTDSLKSFNFITYLKNSVVVTVAATIVTLIINSMAAFALSKYEFKGRNLIFIIIISTLLIPISVILVPVFLVITEMNLNNNLWGVIIPGAATPTGVFLLRQYMLTIPDELIAAARIDGASEWRIYWQVMLPLAAPALAVLTIFSVMWRWNDFLWPLIVLSKNELFTLQVGLNSFQGELNVKWNYILAMTVMTLLPISAVFAFLQKYITTGISSTGLKG